MAQGFLLLLVILPGIFCAGRSFTPRPSQSTRSPQTECSICRDTMPEGIPEHLLSQKIRDWAAKNPPERQVVETKCGHRYHQECISKWLVFNKNGKCPYCRASVSLPSSFKRISMDHREFNTIISMNVIAAMQREQSGRHEAVIRDMEWNLSKLQEEIKGWAILQDGITTYQVCLLVALNRGQSRLPREEKHLLDELSQVIDEMAKLHQGAEDHLINLENREEEYHLFMVHHLDAWKKIQEGIVKSLSKLQDPGCRKKLQEKKCLLELQKEAEESLASVQSKLKALILFRDRITGYREDRQKRLNRVVAKQGLAENRILEFSGQAQSPEEPAFQLQDLFEGLKEKAILTTKRLEAEALTSRRRNVRKRIATRQETIREYRAALQDLDGPSVSDQSRNRNSISRLAVLQQPTPNKDLAQLFCQQAEEEENLSKLKQSFLKHLDSLEAINSRISTLLTRQ